MKFQQSSCWVILLVCLIQFSSFNILAQNCSRTPSQNSSISAQNGEVVCLTEGSYANLAAYAGTKVKICGNVTISGATALYNGSEVILMEGSSFRTIGSFGRYGGTLTYVGSPSGGAIVRLPYTSANYSNQGWTTHSQIRVCGRFRVYSQRLGSAVRSCSLPSGTVAACACPDVSLSTEEISLCSNQQFDLDELRNPETVQGSWSVVGGGLVITNDIIQSGAAPGSYTLVFTADGTPIVGCESSNEVELEILEVPAVEIMGVAQICAGESITLDAGNEGAYFLWSTGETSQTIVVSEGGTYSVTVTNANGCSNVGSFELEVLPQPVVLLGEDYAICEGDVTTLDAQNVGSTYAWNTGETTQTISASAGNEYSVIVTNEFGCSASDEITIGTNPLPVVDLGPDNVVCKEGGTEIDAFGEGLTYSWNTGETTSSITATVAGTYSVTVTDQNGCSGSDEIIIDEFQLKNFVEITDHSCSIEVEVHAGQTVQLNGGSYNKLRVFEGGHLIVTGDVHICGTTAFNKIPGDGGPGANPPSVSEIYGDISFAGPVAVYGGELILHQASSMNFNAQIDRSGGVVNYAGDASCGAQFNLNLPSGSVNSGGGLTTSDRIFVNGSFAVWDGIGNASTGNAPNCSQVDVDPICPNVDLGVNELTICEGNSLDLSSLLTVDTDFGLWSITSSPEDSEASISNDQVFISNETTDEGAYTLNFSIPCNDFGSCTTESEVTLHVSECDNDGAKISSEKEVSRSMEYIEVYPSIANTTMEVNVVSSQSGTAKVRVLSLVGQTVYSSELEVSNGFDGYSIPVSNINNGTYILNVSIGENQYTNKVVIRH